MCSTKISVPEQIRFYVWQRKKRSIEIDVHGSHSWDKLCERVYVFHNVSARFTFDTHRIHRNIFFPVGLLTCCNFFSQHFAPSHLFDFFFANTTSVTIFLCWWYHSMYMLFCTLFVHWKIDLICLCEAS